MSISARRVAIVVLALAGIGFVCGAVVGALVSLIESGFSMRHLAGVLLFGATLGAPIGTVITPVVGFVFARRAPLWKAIVVGAAGALVGASVIAPFGLCGIIGALPGFLLAMIGLYIQTDLRAREIETAAAKLQSR